jgi:hypothetical protein
VIGRSSSTLSDKGSSKRRLADRSSRIGYKRDLREGSYTVIKEDITKGKRYKAGLGTAGSYKKQESAVEKIREDNKGKD